VLDAVDVGLDLKNLQTSGSEGRFVKSVGTAADRANKSTINVERDQRGHERWLTSGCSRRRSESCDDGLLLCTAGTRVPKPVD
jgi:hypothetical protein